MRLSARTVSSVLGVASGLHLLDSRPARSFERAECAARRVDPPRDVSKWSQYGLPGGDSHYLFRENFVVCYDSRTRNAKWVLEKVTAETVSKGAERTNIDFYEDAGVEERFRNRLSDFSGSGYDRGHLAPAANHSIDKQRMSETFSLINISPQVGPGFNRDYWARFEKFVRDLTRVGVAVYIVTGPLYLPRRKQPKDGPSPSPNSTAQYVMEYELLGKPPNLVAVPNFFYKVVLVEQADGRRLVGAFVLPNAAIDPATPLTSFLVPIDSLERAAGLRFFSQYLTDRRRALLDDKLPMIARMDANNIAGLLPPPPSPGGRAKAPEGPVSLLEPSHLCEILQCRLPQENFWEKGGKSQPKGRLE